MKDLFHRPSLTAGHSPLRDESQILQSILNEEPLPVSLNRLCTLVDVQIGNVISMVCLADTEDNFVLSIAETAKRFRLNVFSLTNILSPEQLLLGTFQVFSCDRRRPTPSELHLVERVAHLTGVAIQRHRDLLDIEISFKKWDNALNDLASEKPFLHPKLNHPRNVVPFQRRELGSLS